MSDILRMRRQCLNLGLELWSYLTAALEISYHLVDVGDLGLKDGNGITN